MKGLKIFIMQSLITIISLDANAAFNLNIKINQKIGDQNTEVNQTISVDYNKDIIVKTKNAKNKIILKLKKITNLSLRENGLKPVQVDLKLVNDLEKPIGKTQTVTSFYERSAQFSVQSSGMTNEIADMKVFLDFNGSD